MCLLIDRNWWSSKAKMAVTCVLLLCVVKLSRALTLIYSPVLGICVCLQSVGVRCVKVSHGGHPTVFYFGGGGLSS